MKVLPVPFYAQREIVEDSEKDGACGIVCIKMILDYFHNRSHDVHDLIKEGYIVGGKESAGWNHEALVRVLRNHGVRAYTQEFISHDIPDLSASRGVLHSERTAEFVQLGIAKIKKNIDEGYPVMVSVRPRFGANESAHIILIVGYEGEDTLCINDSQRPSSEEQPLLCNIDRFKEYWKGLSVFVE
jgi:hypothetical protein